MISAKSILDTECDSKVLLPRYRYIKVPLNNLSSSTVTWYPTTNVLIEWKIPANVLFNLSRSFISYQYSWPSLASNFGVVYENACDFSWCSFTDSSMPIAEINNLNYYVHAINPIKANWSEYLSSDQQNQFYPCRQQNTSNLLPFSRDGLSTGVQNASSVPILEPQYLRIGSAVNTAVSVNRNFQLSKIQDSIFSVDTDLVFGRDMYLRFNTLQSTQIGYYTTNQNNPSQPANITAQTANINFSNVYLYLAVEENLNLRDEIMKSFVSGNLKVDIPYQYSQMVSISPTTTQANYSFTLTKNYGHAVKRLLTKLYNGNRYGSSLCYDSSNVNGTKAYTIKTSVDSRTLQDYDLNCYNPDSSINPGNYWTAVSSFSDDYRNNIDRLCGSILSNYDVYQNNWFHCDSFSAVSKDLDPSGKLENLMANGLDLKESGDRIISGNLNTTFITNANSNCNANGLILFVFATYQRKLTVKPDGIFLN